MEADNGSGALPKSPTVLQVAIGGGRGDGEPDGADETAHHPRGARARGVRRRPEEAIEGEVVDEKEEDKKAKYEKEKAEIKLKAEGYLKEYNDINVFDDQFDMTDAFLSIAIALFGITALTQRKWLYYFAVSVSVFGIVLGVAAFLKFSIHPDFITNILS